MKAFVLAIASIFFAPVALAQTKAILPAEKIKILSWNIYMLPGPLGYGNMERSEAIGKLLAASDYDVIVFQEAFHAKARKSISRLLTPAFPFQAGPANQKLVSLKLNSGVWIFSRHTILRSESIVFDTKYGVDALSRKGALLIELRINQQTVQVVGTHLQNAGEAFLKQDQCVELYNRILKKNERPGVPQIVCGDFNIDRNGTDASYRFMLNALEAIDGEVTGVSQYSYDRANNDLGVESGKQRDLIDYILIRSNQSIVVCGDRKVRVMRHRWHERHADLSDHYSIEAELFFRAPEEVFTVSLLK